MNDADLPPLPDATPPGLYRHYKGMFYEVVGTARHSETLEAMTVYRALYGQQGLWVRPAAMFADTVVVDGVLRPRFKRCAALAHEGAPADTAPPGDGPRLGPSADQSV